MLHLRRARLSSRAMSTQKVPSVFLRTIVFGQTLVTPSDVVVMLIGDPLPATIAIEETAQEHTYRDIRRRAVTVQIEAKFSGIRKRTVCEKRDFELDQPRAGTRRGTNAMRIPTVALSRKLRRAHTVS